MEPTSFFARKIGGVSFKIIAYVIAAILIYGVVSKAFNMWPWPNKAVIQAKANQTAAEAVGASAVEAINTVVKGDAERETLKEAAAQVQLQIDRTPTNLPPQVTRQIVVNSLCQLPEYKADPQCVARETR